MNTSASLLPTRTPDSLGPIGQLLVAWRWERRKSRLWPVALAALVFSSIGLAMGFWTLNRYSAEFAAQNVTWEALYLQSGQMAGLLFFPSALAVSAAMDAATEHRNRGWQRARAVDRAPALLYAQVLRNLERSAVFFVVFWAAEIGACLARGYAAELVPAGLAVLTGRCLVAALGGWAISCIITVAGIWIRDFSALAALGVGSTLVGMVALVLTPGLVHILPFSAIAGGMGLLEAALVNLFSVGNMIRWALTAIGWVLVCTLVARRRIAKMEL